MTSPTTLDRIIVGGEKGEGSGSCTIQCSDEPELSGTSKEDIVTNLRKKYY